MNLGSAVFLIISEHIDSVIRDMTLYIFNGFFPYTWMYKIIMYSRVNMLFDLLMEENEKDLSCVRNCVICYRRYRPTMHCTKEMGGAASVGRCLNKLVVRQL